MVLNFFIQIEPKQRFGEQLTAVFNTSSHFFSLLGYPHVKMDIYTNWNVTEQYKDLPPDIINPVQSELTLLFCAEEHARGVLNSTL